MAAKPCGNCGKGELILAWDLYGYYRRCTECGRVEEPASRIEAALMENAVPCRTGDCSTASPR